VDAFVTIPVNIYQSTSTLRQAVSTVFNQGKVAIVLTRFKQHTSSKIVTTWARNVMHFLTCVTALTDQASYQSLWWIQTDQTWKYQFSWCILLSMLHKVNFRNLSICSECVMENAKSFPITKDGLTSHYISLCNLSKPCNISNLPTRPIYLYCTCHELRE
jgi:hypothetical protein